MMKVNSNFNIIHLRNILQTNNGTEKWPSLRIGMFKVLISKTVTVPDNEMPSIYDNLIEIKNMFGLYRYHYHGLRTWLFIQTIHFFSSTTMQRTNNHSS